MCDSHKSDKNNKGDEDMAMIKEKIYDQKKEIVSRQELRKRLIRETINENRVALKRLSRT